MVDHVHYEATAIWIGHSQLHYAATVNVQTAPMNAYSVIFGTIDIFVSNTKLAKKQKRRKWNLQVPTTQQGQICGLIFGTANFRIKSLCGMAQMDFVDICGNLVKMLSIDGRHRTWNIQADKYTIRIIHWAESICNQRIFFLFWDLEQLLMALLCFFFLLDCPISFASYQANLKKIVGPLKKINKSCILFALVNSAVTSGPEPKIVCVLAWQIQ